MAITLETFTPQGLILRPFENPDKALTNAVGFGANLTISYGTIIGKKTSDQRCYPYASGASDGTQVAIGLSEYSFSTDANGKVFLGNTAVTTPSFRLTPLSTSTIFTCGTFDIYDLKSAATPVAEVDTFTPGGTITAGDVNTLTYTGPDLTTTAISFTTATTTAAAVSAGLIAAWNANATTSALATASGTTTVVLTGKTPGRALNTTSSVTGVGTLTKATTTPASGATPSDFTTAFPGSRLQANGALLIPG
jgi:hypothetical protein